ncbi:MAG: BrnT family toxin [Eubacteriales bacterium]|nr:BrnT family toxin [Eubacteriales bacterium]
MQFEWDEEKEQKNIRKHGIDFSTAALVFGDDNRIELYDESHSFDEDRYITIGMVNNILTVVYTVRTDAYRIISARIATNAEKEEYYGS